MTDYPLTFYCPIDRTKLEATGMRIPRHATRVKKSHDEFGGSQDSDWLWYCPECDKVHFQNDCRSTGGDE